MASGATITAVHYPDYQPSLASPPLGDDELIALDELLANLDQDEALNIEMLDGYLTALLLAPVPVVQRQGAEWLPPIWGGDPDSASGDVGAAPFDSSKQKKRAIVLVLRHLHAIDQAIHHHPDRWEPVFSVAEFDDREWADAEDWCVGFLQAVAQDPEGWGRRFDDAELGPQLLPIALLGGDDSTLSPADAQRLTDPEHRDALSRAVPEAVLALVAAAAA